MARSLAALLGAAVLGSIALPASAMQAVCGAHRDVLEQLKRAYSETPASMGLASNGTIIEVLVSSSGTWTIVMTQPNGIACLMAVGEGWQEVPKRTGLNL
jgi:lipase chaperone LimK